MSAPYHPQQTHKAESESGKSVGGWLLVFIILIVFVVPLLTALTDLVSLGFAISISRYLPLLTFLTFVDMLLNSLLACFGIVTGIVLWRKTSRAVGVAKVYLFTRAFYAIFLLFIVGLSMETSDLPPVIKQELPRRLVLSFLPSIVFVMIWFAYFKKSKRVKATYGDPQDDYLTLDLTK